MSLEASEVRVFGTGHIWRAPLDTAFPASITDDVDEDDWTELGYTTPAGIHVVFDRQTKDIFGWQSLDPLRTIVTGVPKRFDFVLMQWNQNTWATACGGGTWTGSTGDGVFTPPDSGFVDECAGIVEITDGELTNRFLIPRWLNKAPLDITIAREDSANLALSMSILAPSGGDDPWTEQSNDDNLVLAASAGS